MRFSICFSHCEHAEQTFTLLFKELLARFPSGFPFQTEKTLITTLFSKKNSFPREIYFSAIIVFYYSRMSSLTSGPLVKHCDLQDFFCRILLQLIVHCSCSLFFLQQWRNLYFPY